MSTLDIAGSAGEMEQIPLAPLEIRGPPEPKWSSTGGRGLQVGFMVGLLLARAYSSPTSTRLSP